MNFKTSSGERLEEVVKDWNEFIINRTKIEVKKVEIGQLNLF